MNLTKKQIRDLMWDAFIEGFNSTGEGWNGEYPFADKGKDPRKDPDVIDNFEQWFAGSKKHEIENT